MIINNLSLINKSVDDREKNRKLKKWLPIMLILSFVWLSLFEIVTIANVETVDFIRYGTEMESGAIIFISIISTCIINWLWFEVLYYFYKTLVSLSVFTHVIPRALLDNRARLFMFYRNLILGLFMNLLFFFPYLVNFVIIVELIVDFTVFIFFFKSATRETVSIMIAPNILKTFFTSFAFIELIHLLIYVVEVL